MGVTECMCTGIMTCLSHTKGAFEGSYTQRGQVMRGYTRTRNRDGYKESVDQMVCFHRLVQRERTIQATRLIHHMLIESQRDLARRTIVHRPHRPDHRTDGSGPVKVLYYPKLLVPRGETICKVIEGH